MPESVTLKVGGRTLVIETGELAKQANGSALVRYGDQNVVLAAVTASEKPREGIDFFPAHLRLRREDVRRRQNPGRLHQARRPPVASTACSARVRSIARSARCSPKASATTSDRHDGALDRSRTRRRRARRVRRRRGARRLSDIPFDKNVAAVRVGRDENGKYIVNPTLPQYETGGMDIVVAGTADAVMMVEGGGNEISEEDFLGAVEFAHDEIKKIVTAIDQLAKKAGKKKRTFPSLKPTRDLEAWVARRSRKTSPKRCASSRRASANAAFASSRSTKRSRRCGKKDATIRALLEDHGQTRTSTRSSRRWKRKNCA